MIYDDIKQDIETILDEYPFDYSTENLSNITNYVYNLLEPIYDSHIYPHIIKQLIAELNSDLYGSNYNYFENRDKSHVVNYLKSLPQPQQRSPEWYKIKQDSIGASECASVFGENPYCSRKQLLKKKVIPDENTSGFNSFTQHGIKYEPIIQHLYCLKHNTNLNEFGSIKHPKLSYISASPDGITDDGTMIEIKAPYAREITGIPPIYYWYQTQQQMEVCNLDKVDYIECKLTEYIGYDEFINDISISDNSDFKNVILNSHGMPKGLFIEYHVIRPNNDKSLAYIYPNLNLSILELKEWITECKRTLLTNSTFMFSKVIYWKLDIYSELRIWRDKEWWDNSRYEYSFFWEDVTTLRNNKETFEKKSKTLSRKRNDCLIVEEDQHLYPVNTDLCIDEYDEYSFSFSDDEPQYNKKNVGCLIVDDD